MFAKTLLLIALFLPATSMAELALPDATVATEYSVDVTTYIVDGKIYKYTIDDGPKWATMTEAGVISGTPAKADGAEKGKLNEFAISYCTDTNCIFEVLEINVFLKSEDDLELD